jgi:chromosome condensin MukBEF MukE localization factor
VVVSAGVLAPCVVVSPQPAATSAAAMSAAVRMRRLGMVQKMGRSLGPHAAINTSVLLYRPDRRLG